MLRELRRALWMGLIAAALTIGPAVATPAGPPAEPAPVAAAGGGHWWVRVLERFGLLGEERNPTGAPAAAPAVSDPRPGLGEPGPRPPGKDEGSGLDPSS